MNPPWELFYGCSEWQDSETFTDPTRARNAFDALCEEPKTMGLHTMDFMMLIDPDGDTAVWEEDDDA